MFIKKLERVRTSNKRRLKTIRIFSIQNPQQSIKKSSFVLLSKELLKRTTINTKNWSNLWKVKLLKRNRLFFNVYWIDRKKRRLGSFQKTFFLLKKKESRCQYSLILKIIAESRDLFDFEFRISNLFAYNWQPSSKSLSLFEKSFKERTQRAK